MNVFWPSDLGIGCLSSASVVAAVMEDGTVGEHSEGKYKWFRRWALKRPCPIFLNKHSGKVSLTSKGLSENSSNQKVNLKGNSVQ